ncbi:DHH family protein [Ureaplasma diversum]|uniref:DHH family protein n=1 Tax=Ureaplasma diversum TaxID=42094 RepID=A0A0C5RQ99_9BACT|nr:bifunctional oligoribonuclease/PAP phosphatase NrnA [Ureaplasma diversum]AJQ45589.1 DHH family protein [Ureaplasma diversum]
MYQDLIKNIIEFTYGASKISIFVHQNPDIDALGSAFALARILRLNTAIMQVKIVGIHNQHEKHFKNLFEFDKEEVDEQYVKDSVGFIVDTANDERVLSNLNHLCKKTMLIDHHVKTTPFTTVSYIDDSSIAACEMIGLGLMNQKDYNFDIKTLNYLLLGITTDSNRLFYDKVSARTYQLMAWFAENGVKHHDLYLQLYERNLEDLKIDTFLLNQLQVDEGVGYIKVEDSWDDQFDFKRWSDKVYLMSNIKEIKIWFITYHDDTKGFYKVSLRSSKYPVRLVAEKYNGGGHNLAAGCILETIDKLDDLINDLKQLIKDN